MSNWQMATAQLRVTGMTCSGCVNAVRSTLKNIPGVQDADVDLAGGHAKVTYDPAQASVEAMVTAVGELGYTATVESTLVE
jgi:copper chaperone CopZ